MISTSDAGTTNTRTTGPPSGAVGAPSPATTPAPAIQVLWVQPLPHGQRPVRR